MALFFNTPILMQANFLNILFNMTEALNIILALVGITMAIIVLNKEEE